MICTHTTCMSSAPVYTRRVCAHERACVHVCCEEEVDVVCLHHIAPRMLLRNSGAIRPFHSPPFPLAAFSPCSVSAAACSTVTARAGPVLRVCRSPVNLSTEHGVSSASAEDQSCMGVPPRLASIKPIGRGGWTARCRSRPNSHCIHMHTQYTHSQDTQVH